MSQVPFLFRVVRASRFLRELKPLRAPGARRTLATVAALTGAGKVGLTLMQYRSLLSSLSTGGLTVEPISAWESWVDEIWAQCRNNCSFAISRDLKTVRELYPLSDRDRGFVLRRNGHPVGWMCARLTRMRDDKYFGNLRVATLMDGMAPPGVQRAAVTLVSQAMERAGADLLVTNQSHVGWIAAFRSAGYLKGPSNYILALSKQLAADIASQPGGYSQMHFTRGDSDGRIHL